MRAISYAVERHRALQALRQAASSDELTGLPNLRGFRSLAEKLLKLAIREARPSTLLYIDVDDLKHVNDRYGHAVGSDLLVRVARALRSVVRESDVLARVGGDEFCLLLFGQEAHGAAIVRQRLQDAIERLNRDPVAPQISLSVGASTVASSQPIGLEELMVQADVSMYANKHERETG